MHQGTGDVIGGGGPVLKNGQQHYRHIIEEMPVAFYTCDAAGYITFFNEAAVKVWGRRPELGRDKWCGSWKIFTPDGEIVPLDECPMAIALKEGRAVDGVEIVVERPDGTRFHVMPHPRPILNELGLVVGAQNTLVDISPLKRADQALRQSEERFRFMAEVLPQHIWTATAEGQVDYVNQRTCEYFGQTAYDLLGEGWQRFIHHDDLPSCLKAWKDSLAKGKPYEAECRILRFDGVYKWHLTRAVPLVKDQEILHWFGTNTDIDEQKRSADQKDEFISVASHELKTPLTSIKAYFQLLEKSFDPHNKSFYFLSKAAHQFDRLESLVSDLLDVSKINAGKLLYNFSHFDFQDLLLESVDSVQLMSPGHQIVIEESASVWYRGDRLRLEQVLHNFLSNAVKYSPKADRVIVKSRVSGNNIVVSVQDFGIGIAPENLCKLFDRFYRIDNTSMKYQGLGLGLYIASEIIKRHHGSFWIESEEGKGSIFYFQLPLNGKQEFEEIATDNKNYYQGNFIDVFFNESESQIEANWVGYQNLESVKKGCQIILDFLQKNKCGKVLNDNSQVLGNWSEAVDWGNEVWFPALEAAGLKKFAWIYSDSTFSKMAARKSVIRPEGWKMQIEFFTNRDAALSWLGKA